MHKDLKPAIRIPFERIFLDPNNPRIAPDDPPGYDKPDALFASAVQERLTSQMAHAYDVDRLAESVIAQGWVPIDPVIVWEHNKKRGHFIVVEGNRRTVVLRGIRDRLPREKAKLDRMREKARKYTERELAEQKALVDQLTDIISDTDELLVYPVNAVGPEDLDQRLPRILGVRHVTHAQQWSPYATNLYLLALYQKLFEERYRETRELALEDDLIARVGGMVSTGVTKTRRNIQAASAFSHFQRGYEDRLSEDDEFGDEDHYYFENLLQNKYAYEQFSFTPGKLYLDPDMEEVLFRWAFRCPRRGGEDSDNILRKAEDIRLWAKMKKYDDEKGTAFAAELDVTRPDDATRMRELEARFLAHKARVSPVDTLRSLLDGFSKLTADSLLAQATHLKPMLSELAERAGEFLAMLDAGVSAKARK
jgi:hypothetical protein